MSKIDIIDCRGDCSYRYYEGTDLLCDMTGRKTNENSPIPDWCELGDARENGDA